MKNKVIVKFLTTFLLSVFLLVSTTSYANANDLEPQGYGGDITKSFSAIMLSNAASMSQYALFDKRKGTYPILTGLEFAERVKSRGVWDYKQTYKDLYLYNGRYLTGESIGNMHYGFVGRASTFSQTLLRSAAGAYQIASKTSKGEWASSYFDDPQDQVMINQGMGFWDNSNLPSTINTLNEMHIENYLAAQLTAEEIKVIEEEFLKDYEEYMSQQQLEK